MSTAARERRYMRRLIPATLAYAVVMLVAVPALARMQQPAFKIALALLPMLPAALMIRAMVLRVIESDEFEQRVHLIALGVATAVVGTASLAGGFLVAAGVVELDGSVLVCVFPALFLVYFIARTWTNVRLGVSVGEQLGGGLRRLWLSTSSFAVLALVMWHGLDAEQRGLLLAVVVPLAVGATGLQLFVWWRARAGARRP